MDWWDVELHALAEGGRHVVRYDHRVSGSRPQAHPVRRRTTAGSSTRLRPSRRSARALGTPVGIPWAADLQLVALRHPELVASPVSISTTAVVASTWTLARPHPELSAFFGSLLPEPDWTDVDAYADWPWPRPAPRRHHSSTAAFERRGRHPCAQPRLAAAGNHWSWSAMRARKANRAACSTYADLVPTLVMHGSRDPLFPLPQAGAGRGHPGVDARHSTVWHEVPPPETWDVVVPALLEHTAGTT
jgi:pimeloyl-ACP methyl ester carboxylesterase